MAVRAPENTNKEFEMAPEGTHVAISYMFAELGLQTDSKGVTKHEVAFWWELPNARMSDGRPFSVHKIYTLSLFERAMLCQDLEGWRGRKYTEEEKRTTDISRACGLPCQLQVMHSTSNGKTYANVRNLSKLMDGVAVPKRTNELVVYDLETDDRAMFDKLPEWVRKKIANRKQPQQAQEAAQQGNPVAESSVPF